MKTVTTLTNITTYLIVNGYNKGFNFDASVKKYNPIESGDWKYKKLVGSYTLDVKSNDYVKQDEYEAFYPVTLIHDIMKAENKDKELL